LLTYRGTLVDDELRQEVLFWRSLADKRLDQAKAALQIAEEWKALYLDVLSIMNARTTNNILIEAIPTGGKA
jgi:hypothetical protein